MRFVTILCLVLLAPASLSAAVSGIKGRVAWRGELVSNVKVRAYASIEAIQEGRVVATAPSSALDGTYKLKLAPGRYYLTASSGAETPRPGDYFCYYSGAPVIVSPGAFRQVGFNLVKVPEESAPKPARRSGLWGEITFQDQLLERSYLYVYKSTETDFRGPAWFVQPVEKGRFRMSLPPGKYWLLARKRVRGGQYGPIEIGDYFNYYHGNPVKIEKGTMRNIQLETITRLSMLEADPDAEFRGIRGKLLTDDGRPAEGLRVFAYRSAKMSGTPPYISSPSDSQGGFALNIAEAGRYWLLAREMIGGPAGQGELYGKWNKGSAASAIELSERTKVKEVQIYVSPHP